MQYKEYYQSALRHLDVCKTLMESLDSMNSKGHLTAKKRTIKVGHILSKWICD